MMMILMTMDMRGGHIEIATDLSLDVMEMITEEMKIADLMTEEGHQTMIGN